MSQVAVVIPAYNEADLVGATVTAAAALPGVDVVVVVDDGSRDATADVAKDAGGRVLRYARNHGKAMAMAVGALEVAEIDRRRPAEGPRHLLFLDADLGATAANAGPLIAPVVAGDADMTVAA
ncbi:MAG: glycosyltransferase, partial [Trebonia sp.]